MLADVDDRVDGEHIAQPEIEREITVGRHQFGVVVTRVVGQAQRAQRARRLDADEHAAQPQPGDHEAALAQHRVVLGRAPLRVDGGGHALGQRRQARAVVGERVALPRGPRGPLRGIVGDALLQRAHQRVAVRGQRVERVALGLHRAQDGHHRGRRVQPHAAADAAFAAGVVREDERDALLVGAQAAQTAPAAREFGHEGDAVGLGPVADHLGLREFAAVRQALEAHGARDDAPVHLGQRDLHRDVAWAQALAVGQPVFAVAAAHDHLQHGGVAGQRHGLATFIRSALPQRGEGGGVEHQLHVVLGAQRAQRGQAQRVFERIERHGQRVQPLRMQRGGQRIEGLGVARQQVRAIEHQRHHGRIRMPAGAQVVDARDRVRRVHAARHMQRHLRQAARRQGRLAMAQAVEGHRAQELRRVARAARAQVLPQLPAHAARRGAAREQVLVFLQVAREHRELLALTLGELLELLQAVGPGRLGPQVVDHHHARMPQHLVDVQVERRGLAQVHEVGQPQRGVAGVGGRQRRARGGEQRERGVGRAEHHDVARRLVEPGDDARVVLDEAAGLGAQQVHAVRRERPPRLPVPCAARLRPGLRR
ncbi:hypothetical protein D3C87_783600 [compost metagenome]